MALAGPMSGAERPKATSYGEVAVFPLPDRPPNTLEKLIAVLRETVPTRSQLEVIQRVLWLQQLSPRELKALRANFPSPWTAPSIPGYMDIDPFRFKEQVEFALVTHPEYPELEEPRLGTSLKAFHLARDDFPKALEELSEIDDPDTRNSYEQGLHYAIQCSPSLEEAQTMYRQMHDERHHFASSKLIKAWPSRQIVRYLETLPVDRRSGLLPGLESQGAHFFSEYEALRDFSQRLSRYPGVVSPRIGEAMAPVMMARSPDQFFAWLSAQPVHHQQWAARSVKKQLARTGSPHLVELYSRFPDLKDKPKKERIRRFHPGTMEPHEYAAAALKQKNPKDIRFRAVTFGKRWGRIDGPAAFAWTMKNVPAEHREIWMRMVLNGWAHEDPEAAGKAFDTLDPKLLNETRDGATMKNRDHQHVDRTPAAFRLPAHLKGPAFPAMEGGPTKRWTMANEFKALRTAIVPPVADLHQGFPAPALNAGAAARVLALGKDTVRTLVGHLQENPPTDARGMAVQYLVTERWALDDPRAASKWLVYAAPGRFRPILPLALSRLAISDPEAAMALSRHVPGDIAWAPQAIARTIAASRGFPKAIELFGDAAGRTLSNVWLRHDRDAAEAWRRDHWIFE